ncbi:hypothetical protein [Prochlorococcus marinus]|uniref:hypothetical protein n=1 Tax=Prochlorococcus marinus TaxID=1219 RepID=UPI001C5998B4|nr:hypothetical protein [Prochlorococcus marinus]MBW3052096.1 hypothetical protein [Prochlorococcus marinus str. MU1416]
MIKNLLDNDENKKDKLLKLSFREIRLEAKKLSLHLYSRKTKKELVELLLKDQKKLLIENKSNDDVVAEEDRLAIEKAKEEDRLAIEKAKEEDRLAIEKAKEEDRLAIEKAKEEDRLAIEKAKEEDRLAIEKAKEEERIAFLKKLQLIKIEKTNAKENEYIISNKNKNLKRLLSHSFPDKKIIVTDNKDGSQTILIN